MDLVNYITKLQTNVFAIRNDDDFADRLNYRYTVAILVTFAIIVSHRQFSETVIKCWVPAFFTPNYESYANQICWISNTYFVNQTQNVPKSEEIRKSSEIKYYQWIPFILLIQALFLYIPRILWRLLSARAGLDMRDLIEAAHSYKSVEKFTNKKKIMEYIVQNIDQYASNPRRSKPRDSIFQKIKYFGESLFCGSGIYLGNYLVTTYFFIKIAYLFNSIIQFFVMNEFLGKQFHELGIDILRYLTNTYSLEGSIDSVYFPKVVMCDFRIREFGHPNFSHRYTIQCVLPINLYNQQIFTFLWFWFLILFCANFWAMCQWINRMLPKSRERYINKRLNMLKHFKHLNQYNCITKSKGIFGRRKSFSPEARRQKKIFINEYLKFDGVFILRMISMLTSEIVGTELLHELWNKRAVLTQDNCQENYNYNYKNNLEQFNDQNDFNDNYNNGNNNANRLSFNNNHIYPIRDDSEVIIYDNEKFEHSKNELNFESNKQDELNEQNNDEKIFEALDDEYSQKNAINNLVENDEQNMNDINQPVDSFQQDSYPSNLPPVEKTSRWKKVKLARLKQQFSIDISGNKRPNRIKLQRIQSQIEPNENQIGYDNQSSITSLSKIGPQQSILTQSRISRLDSIRNKTKKVVFAPSTNLDSPQANLDDLEDVFSDLKIET